MKWSLGKHLGDDEIESLKRSLNSIKVENLRAVEAFGRAANWNGAKEQHNREIAWNGTNRSNKLK